LCSGLLSAIIDAYFFGGDGGIGFSGSMTLGVLGGVGCMGLFGLVGLLLFIDITLSFLTLPALLTVHIPLVKVPVLWV